MRTALRTVLLPDLRRPQNCTDLKERAGLSLGLEPKLMASGDPNQPLIATSSPCSPEAPGPRRSEDAAIQDEVVPRTTAAEAQSATSPSVLALRRPKSTFSVARVIMAWLGRFPSILFLLAYLALIPAFAFLYSHLPNQFLVSTARYEPKIVAERSEVAQDIRDEFLAENPAFQTDFFVPPVKDFSLFTVVPTVDGTVVTFQAVPRSYNVRNGGIQRVELEFKNGATFHPWFGPDHSLTRSSIIEVEVQARIVQGAQPELLGLFPCALRSPNTNTCLRMSLGSEELLAALSQTENGFPGAEQTSFARMLYFSAVTMTTLGYGDIVPITPSSRGWVTLQVFLGPIIVGLFLNSLARQRD